MISRLDTEVGIIMNKLKRNGKAANNTIVIFISDNGATVLDWWGRYKVFMSNGNLRGYKMDLYEGGIGCPASFPGRTH